MKVGSFIPEQSASTLYAMAGDDCSLHHDLSSLTPKQQVDHQENQVLTCQGVTVDLKEGLVNGQIPLRRLVQSIQGRETKIQELKPEGLSLQLMLPNERQFSEIYLMEEAVWASNFNQMYLLGNYDKEVFEEVFHAFPIARLYRLKDLEPLE